LAVLRGTSTTSGLPWDLHPTQGRETAVALAANPSAWPRPLPADTTILVGADLGEGAMFEHASAEFEPLLAAAVLHWSEQRRQALSLAARAGVTVMPLTSSALLGSIEGRYGFHVQIIGHVTATPSGPKLAANDGDVDVTLLRTRIEEASADGYASPVRAVDLTTCASSGDLGLAFLAAGVPFVTTRAESLHLAWVSENLLALYAQGLLDGTSSFQHAWVRAALGEGPKEVPLACPSTT
jgi:hypothetical protein